MWGAAGGERTVNMSKSSRKLNKKKEKAAKVETRRRDAGLREQMKEQMEAGEYAEALGSLAELVKDNSYDPDLMYDGAYSYFMVGDYERATKWVDMVMDLAPYHIPARILLARLCILNEREEGALAISDALLAGSRAMLTEDQAQDLNDILEYYYRCEPERIRADYPMWQPLWQGRRKRRRCRRNRQKARLLPWQEPGRRHLRCRKRQRQKPMSRNRPRQILKQS